MLENASQLFEVKRASKPLDPQSDPVRLYAKIGQLNMELDWLKKSQGSVFKEKAGLDRTPEQLALVRQCQLAGIARSTVYANKMVVVDDYELLLLRLLDEEYTRHPFYGSKKMTVWLRGQGRVWREPKTGAALDANTRVGSYGAWPQYQ